MGMIKLGIPLVQAKRIHSLSLEEQGKMFGCTEVSFQEDSFLPIYMEYQEHSKDIDPENEEELDKLRDAWEPMIEKIKEFLGMDEFYYKVLTKSRCFIHDKDGHNPIRSCTFICQKSFDRDAYKICCNIVSCGVLSGVSYRCKLDNLITGVLWDQVSTSTAIGKLKDLGIWVYPDQYI